MRTAKAFGPQRRNRCSPALMRSSPIVNLFRQVAPYVARILNGERCAQSGLSRRQTRFRNGWPPGYAGGAKSEPVGGFEIVDTTKMETGG
jgi:hypothetical protein